MLVEPVGEKPADPAPEAAPPKKAAVRGWPGVGPQLAERLAKIDVFSAADLILHLPLRYEDEPRLTMLADARPGLAAQCEVEVLSCEVTPPPRRQLVVRAADASGEVMLRFVHFYPSQQKQMAAGARLRIFGELRDGFFGAEMIHPRIRPVAAGEPLPESLTPIYPTTAGLAQSALRKIIAGALRHNGMRDELPEALRRNLNLPALPDALCMLHAPPPSLSILDIEDRGHPAWQRIKLDELLAQQISLRRAYAARRAKNAASLPQRDTLTRELLKQLPFALTGAQRRAFSEIAADLTSDHPMQRLLQGDVGSGKTLVALLSMAMVAETGGQEKRARGHAGAPRRR